MKQFIVRIIATIYCTVLLGVGHVYACNELAGEAAKNERVLILHGVSQSKFALLNLQKALQEAGYEVINPGYESDVASMDVLKHWTIEQLKMLENSSCRTLHLVGFSLGSMMLRLALEEYKPENLGYVVQIAPPNDGSVAVDVFKEDVQLLEQWGQAVMVLGTGERDLPASLPPVKGYDLGVIAGKVSSSSYMERLIPGEDDGIVAVSDTKVLGMKDHVVVDVTHQELIQSKDVYEHVLYFLRWGTFSRAF